MNVRTVDGIVTAVDPEVFAAIDALADLRPGDDGVVDVATMRSPELHALVARVEQGETVTVAAASGETFELPKVVWGNLDTVCTLVEDLGGAADVAIPLSVSAGTLVTVKNFLTRFGERCPEKWTKAFAEDLRATGVPKEVADFTRAEDPGQIYPIMQAFDYLNCHYGLSCYAAEFARRARDECAGGDSEMIIKLFKLREHGIAPPLEAEAGEAAAGEAAA